MRDVTDMRQDGENRRREERAMRRKGAPAALAILLLGAAGAVGLNPGAALAERAGDQQFAICDSRVETFVDRLNDTDAQVSVGLNIREYASLLVRAQASYNRIHFSRLAGTCLRSVAVPAEKSLNAYARAYTAWNDCIRYDLQDDCTSGATNRTVQREWRTAGLNLRRALRYLD
jgi:hypothetical protein